MKQYIKYIGIALILIGVLGASIKQHKSAEGGGVQIGYILPLSGDYGALGENIKKGAELYLEEYRAKYPNQKVEVFFENDELNGPKGLSAFNKLKSINGIDALVSASAPTLGIIYDTVRSESLPTITISSEPKEESTDSIFGISPAADDMYVALGNFLNEKFSGKKIVHVRTNDGLIEKFSKKITSVYKQPITEIITNRSDKDQRTIAAKILAEKPDVIVFSNFAEDGNLIVREIINQTPKGDRPQFIFDPIFTELFSAYEKTIQNMKVLDGSFVFSIKKHNSPVFTEAYTKKYGDKPGQMADIGYDSSRNA